MEQDQTCSVHDITISIFQKYDRKISRRPKY